MFDITNTLSKVDVDDKSAYHPMHGYGMGGPGTIPTLPNIENTAGLGSFNSSEQRGSLPPRERLGSLTSSEPVILEEERLFTSSEQVGLFPIPEPFVDAETASQIFKAVINTSFMDPSVAIMANLDEKTKWTNIRRLAQFPNPFQELFQRKQEMLDPAPGYDSKPIPPTRPPVFYLHDKVCSIIST